MNSIIAEDGDIELLITGLINVSALLANLVAGAFGTSPEGLVGGLLDIYGPFDQPIPADATWAGNSGPAGRPESSICPRQTRPRTLRA